MFRIPHLADSERPHLLVTSEDEHVVFVGAFHNPDLHDPRSQALLQFLGDFFDEVADEDDVIILIEGLISGRSYSVPWNSVEEAFKSPTSEAAAVRFKAKLHGKNIDGLEQSYKEQAADLAVQHDIEAVFLYYVLRLQRQGLQAAKITPREVFVEAANYWGPIVFPDRADRIDFVELAERAVRRFFPDWQFGGAFRNDRQVIDLILSYTGSSPPIVGSEVNAVKAVALEVHKSRREYLAARINAEAERRSKVLIVMGDRHLDACASMVPCLNDHRPIRVLGPQP
ncbi:hypothetical protein [Nocardia gipuzkoensis]